MQGLLSTSYSYLSQSLAVNDTRQLDRSYHQLENKNVET